MSEELSTVVLVSSYQQWLVTHERKLFPPEDQISGGIAHLHARPLFSILLPTFNTKHTFLERCVHSVLEQHYPYWQLCVADDCSSDAQVVQYIRSLAERDSRIQLHVSATNAGISAASNFALSLAEGEFIVLLDHDDELHPFALYEAAAALDRNPKLDLIYSDEDKIDPDGHRVCPAFKPDFDMDMFLAFDYLGHMIALRRTLAEGVGGFRTRCNGAQDWDLLLRALEGLDSGRVHHLSKPLYHWRMHADSTALDLNAKPYVRRAWTTVLTDHLSRTALNASVEPGLFFGSMRVKRLLPEALDIALFLRTEDGAYQMAALAANIGSNKIRCYELLGSSLMRDPGSPEAERIWSFEQIGERVLIFINRPLESVNHEFFEELTSQALRPDCGLVTGISVDAGRVVHSGVVRGPGGSLMDPFAGLKFPHDGYMGQLSVVREVETISDEFFAVRREHVAAIGGLGTVSACFMPRLMQELVRHARTQDLRVLATPYAVATFEGVWPTAASNSARSSEAGAIRLNPNLASFDNLSEVLRGNI